VGVVTLTGSVADMKITLEQLIEKELKPYVKKIDVEAFYAEGYLFFPASLLSPHYVKSFRLFQSIIYSIQISLYKLSNALLIMKITSKYKYNFEIDLYTSRFTNRCIEII
jgi:hypothetical protein